MSLQRTYAMTQNSYFRLQAVTLTFWCLLLFIRLVTYQDTWRLEVDAIQPPYGPWQPRRAEALGRRHHIWEGVGHAMPH
jgi:hypothetical protein